MKPKTQDTRKLSSNLGRPDGWSAKTLHKRFGTTCFFCNRKPGITVDHLVPISRGGTDTLRNLVPACEKCNHSKGNRMPTAHELAKRDAFWKGEMHTTPKPMRFFALCGLVGFVVWNYL